MFGRHSISDRPSTATGVYIVYTGKESYGRLLYDRGIKDTRAYKWMSYTILNNEKKPPNSTFKIK